MNDNNMTYNFNKIFQQKTP